VIITDIKDTILYVNPAFERISGYSCVEALGQSPGIVKSGRHDEAFYQDLWQTITAGKVWRGRFTNRNKDGSLYTEDAIITPVRNSVGEIVNYVATMRDVTREVELEEQFRQAQKMEALGRLAGGVAHDFNNLLTVIHLSTRFLEQRLLPQDPLWEHVQRIREAGQRATKLTAQLLSFSRREVVASQLLNLNEVVGDMSKMLRRIIGEDIELILKQGEDLWQVRADPSRLDQVIVNLVINSRDAMPDGGTLTVETANVLLDEAYAEHHVGARPGEHVLLSVSDTGVGMSSEVQERIFEPFFTTKEPGKGTGLGLATVYGIVRQAGGHIWLYSEEGQGTIFKVYLPCASGTGTEQQARLAMSRTPEALGGETVLVVEDNAGVRDLTVAILETRGYRVLTADGGRTAMQVEEEHDGPIHLLLADVVMPEMNGPQLAKLLCSRRPEMRVLFMSGYADETIARHGVLEEGVALLSKPLTLETLTQRVRAVLDGKE
jgi:PAS domain S-box-containing protein